MTGEVIVPFHSRKSSSSKSKSKENKSSKSSRRNRTPRRIAPAPPAAGRTMETSQDKYESPVASKDKYEVNLTVDAGTPQQQLRNSEDIRSPGQRKSPLAVQPKVDIPIPDFITQTDRFGNASTPRSAEAVEKARLPSTPATKPDDSDSESDVDACTETFLDSFRIMCCCFVPEDSTGVTKKNTALEEDEDDEAVAPQDDRPKLLPAIHPNDEGKKCLVLDLDETLVHSSFRAVPGADFVIPVQIEDVVHFVYVMKRPGVDEFLVEMAKHYELVIYTASLNKYADPLLDLLDPHRVIRHRLFRESCVYYEGNYVKDLSLIDRDLSQSIIVDNSPSSYIFHPENAIDCSSFIDDPKDRELDQIAAFLKGVKNARDVRGVCHEWRDWPNDKADQ